MLRAGLPHVYGTCGAGSLPQSRGQLIGDLEASLHSEALQIKAGPPAAQRMTVWTGGRSRHMFQVEHIIGLMANSLFWTASEVEWLVAAGCGRC